MCGINAPLYKKVTIPYGLIVATIKRSIMHNNDSRCSYYEMLTVLQEKYNLL